MLYLLQVLFELGFQILATATEGRVQGFSFQAPWEGPSQTVQLLLNPTYISPRRVITLFGQRQSNGAHGRIARYTNLYGVGHQAHFADRSENTQLYPSPNRTGDRLTADATSLWPTRDTSRGLCGLAAASRQFISSSLCAWAATKLFYRVLSI